jgi:hypothetical protein
MTELVLIGFERTDNDWEVVNAQKAREQIDYVKSFECALTHKEEPLTWDVFDDPKEGRALFQAIEADRKVRVDKRQFMVDRPPYAAVTIMDGRVVRLEYYEGHDALELTHDIRSKELVGKKLPPFMRRDGAAYDPVAFLEDAFGIPRDVSEQILKEFHKKPH